VSSAAVIIPCFNAGRTIGESVASVRSQLEPVAECIIVDDGSDDPFTRRVLADLRRSGWYVLRTENRGVAAARNLGFTLTSSPYIVFLDADDVMEESYVQKLAAVLDRSPEIDFVTTGIRAFGEADYLWTPAGLDWIQTFARGGPHVSSMFRRHLWRETGGLDETLEGYEDQDWWLTAIERGHHGAIVEEPLLRYRVRAGSRYDRAILPGQYRRTMAALIGKHPGSSDADRVALAVEKELFRAELLKHAGTLAQRRADLELRAQALAGAADAVRAVLARCGVPLIDWGRVLDRASPQPGTPLDAYYRDKFLGLHHADLSGTILELDVSAGALASCCSASLDCLVMMESLNAASDFRALLAEAFRVLKPGGVLLCAAISLGDDESSARAIGRWFTPAALRAALAELWPAEQVDVTSFGNLQVCVAYLAGTSGETLGSEMLSRTDESFPLLGCARAVKPPAPAGTKGHGNPRGASTALVLLYHRIGEEDLDTYDLQVGIDEFRQQLHYVTGYHRLLPLDEIVSGLRSGVLPDRAVAVTFDDGYLQHLEVVLPILREIGVPATFFVNTEGLGRRHENWWDAVERVMNGSHALPDAMDLYGDGRVSTPTRTREERIVGQRVLTEHLYGRSFMEREAALRALERWSGISLSPRDSHRALLAHELCELAGSPHAAIAAHTVHHLALPRQAIGDQWIEVSTGKSRIEEVLGRPISGFSYPYGETGRTAVDAARSAGFAYAVTVEQRAVRPGANPLLLPRCEVKAHDRLPFDERLAKWFRLD
jgi:peptidoglycan/xylan/chitin deacetylase (PgdA/CDA1 family)